MKRMMMLVVVLVGLMAGWVRAAGGPIPIDLRRQLYELNCLLSVEKLQVDMYDQDGGWRAGATAPFKDGEASLEMDITPGPGNYGGYAWWMDKWGCPLFQCTDWKLTTFRVGVNVKDFPVLLCQNRMLRFMIEGPASNDGVWVNGQQAQYSDGYWRASVNQPWAIDEIEVIWNGHGAWTMLVNPSSNFGEVINLAKQDMDPNQGVASQMLAVSYPGEDSWTYGIASYMYNVGDEQGNVSAQFAANIPYGTEVMVFFSYWEQYFGTIVEYHNTTVKVVDQKPDGTIILIPLTGTWFTDRTQVRLVYTDANGVVRQTWVSIGGKG